MPANFCLIKNSNFSGSPHSRWGFLNAYLCSLSSKRFRNTRAETVNTAKATAEAAANISSKFPIGDLNNKTTEIIKAAPVKPIPKIEIAKILFIGTLIGSQVIEASYYSSYPTSSNNCICANTCCTYRGSHWCRSHTRTTTSDCN